MLDIINVAFNYFNTINALLWEPWLALWISGLDPHCTNIFDTSGNRNDYVTNLKGLGIRGMTFNGIRAHGSSNYKRFRNPRNE